MDYNLFVREFHEDYRVKDSETFARDHARNIKKMTFAPVQLEGEKHAINRRVKVKSITDKLMEWDKEEKKWAFSCSVKVKVFDD